MNISKGNLATLVVLLVLNGINCVTNPCRKGSTTNQFFSHPESDDQYIQCSQWGQMFLFSCPDGLKWNLATLSCEQRSFFSKGLGTTPVMVPQQSPVVTPQATIAQTQAPSVPTQPMTSPTQAPTIPTQAPMIVPQTTSVQTTQQTMPITTIASIQTTNPIPSSSAPSFTQQSGQANNQQVASRSFLPSSSDKCSSITINNARINLVNGIYSMVSKDMYRRSDDLRLPGLIVEVIPNRWCVTYTFSQGNLDSITPDIVRGSCGRNLECCIYVTESSQPSSIGDAQRNWFHTQVNVPASLDSGIKVNCQANAKVCRKIKVCPPECLTTRDGCLECECNGKPFVPGSEQVQKLSFTRVLQNKVAQNNSSQTSDIIPVTTCSMVKCPKDFECKEQLNCKTCNPACFPVDKVNAMHIVMIDCQNLNCPADFRCVKNNDVVSCAKNKVNKPIVQRMPSPEEAQQLEKQVQQLKSQEENQKKILDKLRKEEQRLNENQKFIQSRQRLMQESLLNQQISKLTAELEKNSEEKIKSKHQQQTTTQKPLTVSTQQQQINLPAQQNQKQQSQQKIQQINPSQQQPVNMPQQQAVSLQQTQQQKIQREQQPVNMQQPQQQTVGLQQIQSQQSINSQKQQLPQQQSMSMSMQQQQIPKQQSMGQQSSISQIKPIEGAKLNQQSQNSQMKSSQSLGMQQSVQQKSMQMQNSQSDISKPSLVGSCSQITCSTGLVCAQRNDCKTCNPACFPANNVVFEKRVQITCQNVICPQGSKCAQDPSDKELKCFSN